MTCEHVHQMEERYKTTAVKDESPALRKKITELTLVRWVPSLTRLLTDPIPTRPPSSLPPLVFGPSGESEAQAGPAEVSDQSGVFADRHGLTEDGADGSEHQLGEVNTFRYTHMFQPHSYFMCGD